MSADKRAVRVLVFDRGLVNPYSLGLVHGLERLGIPVALAGPQHAADHSVTAVYPREGVPGQKAQKAVDGVTGIARLTRLAAGFRPDVLHFQWGMLHDYALARLVGVAARARVVFTVHNPVPRDAGYRWQQPMIRVADALIVHGETLRQDLLRTYHLSPSRVHVVPHGNFEHAVVRHDRAEARRRLGLPLDTPVFAFVGQLLARKGVLTLVEAFRRHCELGRPGALVLAGAGYGLREQELREAVAPHAGRVHWLVGSGALPAEQLDLVVSAATQIVLPFHVASQSGSVIYSMTHGRCVVTTTVGELPNTLGERGLLVPPRDAAALLEALDLAVRDPGQCDRLGAAARRYALEELDWSRLAARTVDVYRSALA